MRTIKLLAVVGLAALTGCGLEGFIKNVGRAANERPASAVSGQLPANAVLTSALGIDASGSEVKPFETAATGSAYELRFPSSNYSMFRVQVRSGDGVLRGIVPSLGEETSLGLDLDARIITETLITEAALSAQGESFATASPEAYVGNGTTTGARTLIRQDLDTAGPTRDLLGMVERILAKGDPEASTSDSFFFNIPVLDEAYAVTASPVDGGWLQRMQFDYDGDGVQDLSTAKFDAKLAEAAAQYEPAGCPDPTQIRLVFTVDYAEGNLDGRCQVATNWTVAADQAGKSMYFVGWVQVASEVQDPDIAVLLGNGVPNQIPMYDDGTNGDEASGDGIWTVAFAVPFDPAKKLRVGYKYTWGFRGMSWSKTEEWPGNSRILQVEDLNGDDIVYRRDVFGDEATNKNLANLNPASGGALDWDEDLHGCGPEAREQKFTLHNACVCGASWFEPKAVGPVRVACSE